MAQGGNHANKGPRAIRVDLPKLGRVTFYANKTVADALQELETDMTLYKAVRLGQLLEAAYEQGRRDGRRQLFDKVDGLKKDKELKYRNPGGRTKK